MRINRTILTLSAGLLLAAPVSACGSQDSEPAGAAPDGTGTACEAIAAEDAWTKAAEEGMTATFGMLKNSSDAEVNVVAASSDSAAFMELHEVVDSDGEMVMQAKEGGFVIPAGGAAMLEPGADHLMMMEIPAPIAAGDDVTVTLECSDGSTTQFTAQAKDFAGGEEEYQPGMDGEDA